MENPIPEIDAAETAFDAVVEDATSFLSDGIDGLILTHLISTPHEHISEEDVQKVIVCASQILKSRQ